MNGLHHLDKKLQYDFYYHGLPAKKRYNKWLKPEAINNIELLKEYYSCSNAKAKEIVNVLTEEQIKIIEKRMYKGGIVK